MGWFINEKGSLNYVRSGYRMSNTHGADYATADLHKIEIEAIINEIVNKKLDALIKVINADLPKLVQKYGDEVWERMIKNLVGALRTDVKAEVSLGFEGLRDVFYGEKYQKYISDNIMKTMVNELKKVKNIEIY